MADRRSMARIGGRVAACIGGLAVAAVAIAGAAMVDWPEARATPASTVVQPAESRQLRLCPGPLLDLGLDLAAADTASSIGPATTTVAVDPEDAVVERTELQPDANPNAGQDGAPLALSAAPGSVVGGLLAGAQSQTASTDTVRGFAATACAEAVDEAWLVGGSTEVGRSSLVLLANPGGVPSTIDLEITGAEGRIDAPGASGIILPPGSQRVISLAGLAPDEAAPVVHVTALGSPIVASLEQTIIRGLQPGGVELVGAAAAPSVEQIIPGFIVGTAGGADPLVEQVDGDEHPVVRLAAPGGEPARVSISLVPESGGQPRVLDATLAGGRVSDVPLGVLDAGVYTVLLQADAPIVAAARAEAIADGARDLVWAQTTAPLVDRQTIAVAEGPSPTLHLANPGGRDAEVLVSVDGAARTLAVGAGGTASLAVTAGSSIVLEGVEGLHAAVGYLAAGAVAQLAVQPPGPLDTPIRVYPR